MKKRLMIPLSIFAVLAIGSCHKTTKIATLEKREITKSVEITAPSDNKKEGNTYGKIFKPQGAITYDAMRNQMLKTVKLDDVKVSGTVETVCKAKGCWMNIASEKGAPPMHVQFKDYAFFMPLDIEGKKVVMLGKAVKEVTSVEDLRHFAQDEGKSKEDIAKITQPKEELKFLAEGVLILDL
jgi:Domain of unknown function (DUF4920)